MTHSTEGPLLHQFPFFGRVSRGKKGESLLLLPLSSTSDLSVTWVGLGLPLLLRRGKRWEESGRVLLSAKRQKGKDQVPEGHLSPKQHLSTPLTSYGEKGRTTQVEHLRLSRTQGTPARFWTGHWTSLWKVEVLFISQSFGRNDPLEYRSVNFYERGQPPRTPLVGPIRSYIPDRGLSRLDFHYERRPYHPLLVVKQTKIYSTPK